MLLEKIRVSHPDFCFTNINSYLQVFTDILKLVFYPDGFNLEGFQLILCTSKQRMNMCYLFENIFLPSSQFYLQMHRRYQNFGIELYHWLRFQLQIPCFVIIYLLYILILIRTSTSFLN